MDFIPVGIESPTTTSDPALPSVTRATWFPTISRITPSYAGETGEEFSVNISLESSMRYRARPDASTILWWMEQSEEARKSLTSNTQELSTALSWLSEFIIKNANHKLVQVWGNGASFDCVILRNSYSLTGQPVPWQWWNDRDVRTIVELGKAIGFDPKRDMPFKGTRHNALDDAIHQAKYVSAIWKKLAK
ncbi:TPA: 3'-5' exoribonuclease [Escherichia coli]|nr:3'-5' exoribonuclease [Escherichia coli]